MTDTPDEIRIGDRVIRVEEPNGWKFIRATELLAQISAEIPDLQAKSQQFIRGYQESNAEHIERWLAVTRFPPEMFPGGLGAQDDDWWQQRGGKVTILGPPPGPWEQGLAMATHLLRAGKEPVVELIAILAAPAGEIAAADRDGSLPDYLDRFKRDMLHGAPISKLVLILARAFHMMQAEFAADGEAAAALGELRKLVQPPRPPDTPTPSSSSNEPSENATSGTSPPPASGPPTPPISPDRTPEPQPTGEPSAPRPTSSTDSPPPTDGTVTTPSSDLPGPSFATSQPASVPAS